MKKLIIFFIYIFIFFSTNLLFNIQLKSQETPCSYTDVSDVRISSFHLAENSIAVNPNYPNILLCASNTVNNMAAFSSTDWGNSWFGCCSGTGIFDPNSGGDPASAIDLNGRFYVAYVARTVQGKITRLGYSDNLGNDWTTLDLTNNGTDKPHLHIDNSCNSSYKGRIYCAWTKGGENGKEIELRWSSNRGNSWSEPYIIASSISFIQKGVNITTDNAGKVFVVWAIYNDQHLWEQIGFSKSTNGGLTWTSQNPLVIYTASSLSTGIGPSITANVLDNSLYIVYSGTNPINNTFDVYFFKSTNGGNNWLPYEDPQHNIIPITQTAAGDQTYPWISCDPMTGYLACVYYDTREENNPKNTYLSISTNSGTSWCDMKVSNYKWDNDPGTAANDYIGVEFNKGIIFPVWADTRNIGGDYDWKTYISPVDVIPRDYVISENNTQSLIQSANSITSNTLTIHYGANLTLQTVKSIILNPGFTADEGSHFTAEFLYCAPTGNDSKMTLSHNKSVAMKKSLHKEKDNTIPDKFELLQNYPNPFNPTTLIKYALKENVKVKLTIYNILGQEVKTLVDEIQDAGYKSVIWDGTNISGISVTSGVYFYKIIAGSFIDKKKMVLLR